MLASAAEAALEQLDRPDILARLLGLKGAFALRNGQIEEAERLWRHKLALAEQLQDTASSIDSLCDLAQLAQQARRFAAAGKMLGKAIRLARRQKRRDLIARPLGLQAETALATADLARAVKYAEQARAQQDPDADMEAVIDITLILGRVYRAAGDHDGAEAALLQMLRVATEASRVFDISRALLELGELYEGRHELPAAARAYIAAERVHSDLPSQRRELTKAERTRFEEQFGSQDVRDIVEHINVLSWQEIVTHLLTRS
jgi:tetratricopeptide (TPR) repeat protein